MQCKQRGRQFSFSHLNCFWWWWPEEDEDEEFPIVSMMSGVANRHSLSQQRCLNCSNEMKRNDLKRTVSTFVFIINRHFFLRIVLIFLGIWFSFFYSSSSSISYLSISLSLYRTICYLTFFCKFNTSIVTFISYCCFFHFSIAQNLRNMLLNKFLFSIFFVLFNLRFSFSCGPEEEVGKGEALEVELVPLQFNQKPFIN